MRLWHLLVNWVYRSFLISFGVSYISKKITNHFFPYHLTFARHSLEPRSMFIHQLLPLILLQVISLGVKACFENAYVQLTHGERGHRDMIVFMLSRTVISMASVGCLWLEYDIFFRSGKTRYCIPVPLFHGIQRLETNHVPTRRCRRCSLTLTT